MSDENRPPLPSLTSTPRRSLVLPILTTLAVLFCLFAGCIRLGIKDTRIAEERAGEYMHALNQGRYEDAWRLMAPEVSLQNSAGSLADAMTMLTRKHGKPVGYELSVMRYGVFNDQTGVTLAVQQRFTNKTVPCQLLLIERNGQWEIAGFHISM